MPKPTVLVLDLKLIPPRPAITKTFTEMVTDGLLDADDIDPHDFAPYCEHDPWPSGVTSPLYSCAVCDWRWVGARTAGDQT